MTNPNRQRYLERRKETPPLKKKFVVEKDDNMSFLAVFSAITFIGSILFFVVNIHKIDISNFGLFRLLAITTALWFFIPIKLYRKIFTMSFYEYVIFNIISFAPTSIVLLFILNLALNSSPYIETYTISSFEPFDDKYIFHLVDEQYEDDEYLRTIYGDNFPKIEGTSEYSIKFSDGYFGLRVIEDKSSH
ncbi:hypothetical protein N9B55_00955 [Vicingaceae bacterium]|nr:hypothetical protein [Vicingaceae bacterium]